MQMGVKLEERELAVAGEQSEADRAQAPAIERLGVVAERRERTLVGAGRAATVVVRDDRPDSVAELLRSGNEGAALLGTSDRLGVERRDLGQQAIELGRELGVLGTAQAGVEAEEEQVAGVAAAALLHVGAPGLGVSRGPRAPDPIAPESMPEGCDIPLPHERRFDIDSPLMRHGNCWRVGRSLGDRSLVIRAGGGERSRGGARTWA